MHSEDSGCLEVHGVEKEHPREQKRHEKDLIRSLCPIEPLITSLPLAVDAVSGKNDYIKKSLNFKTQEVTRSKDGSELYLD